METWSHFSWHKDLLISHLYYRLHHHVLLANSNFYSNNLNALNSYLSSEILLHIKLTSPHLSYVCLFTFILSSDMMFTHLLILFLCLTFSTSRVQICKDLWRPSSSFLFRGYGSWLFNLITKDWWHQVQSCADLSTDPPVGISWDEERWDGTSSVSVKRRLDKWKVHSRWAPRSQHISQFVGDPAIRQVRIHHLDSCLCWI